MDLLAKFDAIQINTENQIAESDRAFCEAHQKAYENARESLVELVSIWNDMMQTQKQLLSGYGDSHEVYITAGASIHISKHKIREQICEMHKSFINNLLRYFCKTYHFDISDYEIKKGLLPQKPEWKYGAAYNQELEVYENKKYSLQLHYTQILEQMHKEMGGARLDEYALSQIKEGCWRSAWRYNEPNYERNKQVIRFRSAVNSDYELYESTKKILRALAYFETGVIDQIPCGWGDFYRYHGPGYNAYDFDDGIKITKFRLYRNHRMDVRFREEAYAVRFIDEYLRTVPWEG